MSRAWDEEPEVFRDTIVYREWGYRLAKLEKYVPAISCFEKTLKLAKGEDLRTLLGLCWAQLNYTRYLDANETSKKCMNIDPRHYLVKHARVHTLFKLGEFSYSLIHAHQGMRIRQLPFRWAVYQGNETIEDCVGENTSPVALWLLYPWIRMLQEHRKVLFDKLGEEEDEFEGIDEDQSKFKVNDETAQREAYLKKLYRIISKMYLGYLAVDKDFVERIMENPDMLDSPNKESSRRLHNYAVRCYRKSKYREDVLRTRQPLYVTLFKRRRRPEGFKGMLREQKQLRRSNIVIEADFLLRKLQAARMNGDYPNFFRLVDRVKDKFDHYSDDLFPLKKKCLHVLYKMVALAYMDARNVKRLDSEEARVRYLKHHFGIYVAKLPRSSDLAWVPVYNRKKTLRVFRRRLPMASDPLELSWLFHEFCKFLIQIDRLDLARFYIKKAREASQAAKTEEWLLNANHLMLRIEIAQNNRNEAKEAAAQTLSNAKKLGVDHLVDFYSRTIRLIDQLDVEFPNGISARQQLMLQLMPEDMKTSLDVLWRNMEAVPAERRLSVMPGCKPIDRTFALTCKRETILPGPPRNPEADSREALLKKYEASGRRPGFVDFREFE